MNKALDYRYNITVEFALKHLDKSIPVLDLGAKNPLSELLEKNGFHVTNTKGDLDVEFDIVEKFSAITAFEIFEHMFAPFNLLNMAKGKLIASVPLKLWFAPAYWNDNDKLDCHYHEFEEKQFNHLLDRTGWKIIDSKKWAAYDNTIGIRPLLRRFYPRYYMVYAEK
jgi:hypothetical protein